jgi:hypothetical protein
MQKLYKIFVCLVENITLPPWLVGWLVGWLFDCLILFGGGNEKEGEEAQR